MASVPRKITKPTLKARLSSHSYSAFLFDLDGVLVDAVGWHARAFLRALREEGYELTDEDHMANLNGLPTTEKLARLRVLEKDRPTIEAKKKLYTNELIEQECRPDPAKIALLSLLDREGYFLACCSNAKTESVKLMLAKSGLDIYLDVILGSDDVEKSKPDPEIYLKAAALLNLGLNDCMIFEDSPVGVEAARRSYMPYLRVTYDMVNTELVRGYLSSDVPNRRHARQRHKRLALSARRHTDSSGGFSVGKTTGGDDVDLGTGQP